MKQVAQVGGTHYQSEYQHWDWVADVGLDYFAAQATKYLCRWKSKNGIEDLKKAESFVAKLIEVSPKLLALGERRDFLIEWNLERTRFFIETNSINGGEALACYLLVRWRTMKDLEKALELIREIIQAQKQEQPQEREGYYEELEVKEEAEERGSEVPPYDDESIHSSYEEEKEKEESDPKYKQDGTFDYEELLKSPAVLAT